MHRFDNLKTPIQGYYILQKLIRLLLLLYGLAPENNINRTVKRPVDCKAVTKYKPILFAKLGEYIFEFL